jgi:glycosyltransferase AglD
MAESPLPPVRTRLPRLTVRRVAVLAFLGVTIIALLVSLSGGRATLGAFSRVQWPPLILAICIHYAGFALRGHRWQLLLARMGHRLRYLPVLALLLAGWFASALLPARAGEILRIVALRGGIDDGPPVPVADSLGSIVLERVLDILAIVILGAIFAFFTISQSLPRWVAVAYGIAIAALLLLALALVLAPAFMAALRRWWDNRWWQAALSFAERFVTALRSLARDPAAALVVIGESLVIWLCDAMLLWLALLSLGVTVSFGPAAFVALTVDIVAALPLTPGGIGQFEVATAALLALLGIPAPTAAAAVLIVRGISYWSFLLFSGAVAFWAGFTALIAPARPVEGAEA